ncbi:MAG: BA14K family protein [Mesorhizobium sp.]|nr:BA14K family protein [Mesorhizobium sp.]
MKRKLSAVAAFAVLALGFGLASPANATVAASANGAISSAAPATVVPAQFYDDNGNWVNPRGGREWRDRRDLRDRRDYRDRRDWRGRRDWRDDDRWRYRRHYRPRPTIEFHVAPAPRYRPRPGYRLSAAHYRWCEARWRSYRAYDNSYQPYNGPRRECVSPLLLRPSANGNARSDHSLRAFFYSGWHELNTHVGERAPADRGRPAVAIARTW